MKRSGDDDQVMMMSVLRILDSIHTQGCKHAMFAAMWNWMVDYHTAHLLDALHRLYFLLCVIGMFRHSIHLEQEQG